MANENKNPLSMRALALDLLDTDQRREHTVQLLDEFLPALAAEIENILSSQDARVGYELLVKNDVPKLRVVLRLKKFDHEFLVHLDSQASQFVVGSERGGQTASNAVEATRLLRTMLTKFKA